MSLRTHLAQGARAVIRHTYGARPRTIRGEGGLPLEFCPTDYPSLLLFGLRRFEPELVDRWRALLRPHDVIFDVGSNIGITVQRFSALLDGRCEIHAFEPIPRNLELLRRNVAPLGAHVTVIDAAVGDADGETIMHDNLSHGGLSRLGGIQPFSDDDRRLWEAYAAVPVRLLTLDGYCAARGYAPTFVKIDVEGAGGRVLSGAMDTLHRHQPTVTASIHSTSERDTMLRILQACGYRGIRVAPHGLRWCALTDAEDFAHPQRFQSLGIVAQERALAL